MQDGAVLDIGVGADGERRSFIGPKGGAWRNEHVFVNRHVADHAGERAQKGRTVNGGEPFDGCERRFGIGAYKTSE